jgi:hypothetical protein
VSLSRDEPLLGGARRRRTRPRTGGDRDEEAAPESAAPAKPVSKAERDAERGLRGLVGSGPSQVGVDGALRARDASRPTEEDIAAAEQDLVIVRRHYIPTDPPPE